MAGSLAHEIGNPLSGAKLLAQKILCHRAIDAYPEVQHDLQALVTELRRIEVLVRKAQMISRVRSKPYAGDLSIIDFEGSAQRSDSA
jgi:signal transduction histidine kinase